MSSPVKAPSQPPKASSSNTKKRKRADASQLQHPDSTVRFSLVEDSASLDPVLACAGALPVPNDVDFNVYKSSTNESSFIFGENRKQEWESRNLVRPSKLDQGQKPDDARGYDSQYMLAVYNKRTNQAQLIPSPAHIIAPTLKRLKHLSTISAPTDNENRAIQRDALGTAFGSKRAKANIRAAERSKIDVSSADLQAYQPELQATLGDVLSNLPDTADLANMTASASLIPKFNVNASDPSEAYPIENIVSRPELAAMPIKDCLQASTLSERMSCMPTRQSAFAADALKRLVTSISDSKWDKPAKEKLRRLVYFVTLLAFNRTGSKKSMDDLRTKLGVADVVIEGLLERFTENIKGSKKISATSGTQVKLLTFICALSLHISDFSTNMSLLAQDLHLPLAKVQDLFRSLGCTIVYPSKEEKEQYVADGMSAKQIKEMRKATIKLPLEFPKPKVGRKKAT